MNHIVVNLSGVQDHDELFDVFEREMNLPVYFGRNLDALHDLLSYSEMTLILRGVEQARENIGSYADTLVEMLTDIAEESENFRLIVE